MNGNVEGVIAFIFGLSLVMVNKQFAQGTRDWQKY